MSSDLELPAELVSRPLALVGLTGLNIESNPTHLVIWNSFTLSNRSERPPLNFVLFGVNHAFPPAKPDVSSHFYVIFYIKNFLSMCAFLNQRTSYEWYIPKGILKRKWMSKHLHQIPGVLVLFYDLEWDDMAWKAKHTECANLIQSMRYFLIFKYQVHCK